MKTRMMCTDCGRTAEADTLLEGSDTLELVAWCCFALPGLLYCWWRHALRIKVCAFCGSLELVREARAAAARQPGIAPLAAPAPVRSLSGRIGWPPAFASPRERLRHGGLVALFASALLASLVPAALNPAGAGWAFASSAAALGLVWVGVQGLRMAQASASLLDCRAWDAEGRPIQIERVF